MSEKEKKKRAGYKKNRDRWIFAQSLIIAVITLAIIISGIVAYQLESTYYIGYREVGNIDYNVFLKENDFYDEDHLGKGQSYVASLIDKIIADFTYEIDMDTSDVNYRYSYKIDSRLEIVDNTSGVAIFNQKEELVNVQNKSQSSSKRLVINEIVVLKYDEYNELAARFLETYSLTQTTSNIVLTLEVDVLSDCNAFSGSSVENYTSELRIPLTTKTVNVKMTSTVPDAEAKMIACTRGAGSEVFKTTAIVLSVVDGLLILLLVAFVCLTRTDDITYTAKVNRIISQYKSYIQKIKNLFDMSEYKLISVETFDELLEIRDTIQAPILMYENNDKTCTKFIIPTDSKLLYLYEIKIEGYVEPEPEPKPEPVPTTICKPNITNVVRPVVKVVVTPPQTAPAAEQDTKTEEIADVTNIIENAEIEIEGASEQNENVTEVTAEVYPEEECEIIDEQDQEITELLESIPTAEEPVDCDSSIEVIDVAWLDSDALVYDPDGNNVEEGDVVLVPATDENTDKEVIREAEVKKGNYKVPASEVNGPLKKIIGVVRRRAEKVFTAMIEPNEANTDITK